MHGCHFSGQIFIIHRPIDNKWKKEKKGTFSVTTRHQSWTFPNESHYWFCLMRRRWFRASNSKKLLIIAVHLSFQLSDHLRTPKATAAGAKAPRLMQHFLSSTSNLPSQGQINVVLVCPAEPSSFPSGDKQDQNPNTKQVKKFIYRFLFHACVLY